MTRPLAERVGDIVYLVPGTRVVQCSLCEMELADCRPVFMIERVLRAIPPLSVPRVLHPGCWRELFAPAPGKS